ncbi:MAG TPA: hypothetical protein IAD42_02760 [Candidatus Scatomorpha pullistercoris]|uniref:Glycosyl hydrolase family 13 catalytic domain-containing protein n=1 Tax=Candidatus Scatomorpha pullistercoris TaxID=2840929 RepID=A0A9D1G4J7_9FIRM|nr:hypothetical protein [Candidatus Scatomorpha pullistercoris]
MKTRARLAGLLLILAMLLSACGEQRREAEPNIIDDKYRNWYEVFVYSYYDSDGDRTGDLAGLAEKLDYISGLGMNGIWLMPIMPSPSYHKYDVTDYYDIDPQYGTLEDFSAMLEKAHSLGIDVIIDLVVNHTSSEHPWFTSAKSDENSEYRDWYNWSDTQQDGYAKAGDAYYECRFVNTMPDLNLDNPEVRAEIENILRFWLEDMGVDGFRLDAVTSYYTGNTEKNKEFLSWLGDTARSIKPDCYIVGEAWTDLYEIADYCEAGIDSFFLFPVAQRGGYIEEILGPDVKEPGRSYGNVTALLEMRLPEGTIPAPFLGNHDTARAASMLGPDIEKQKMAAGLLAMMRGGTFVYYGDEIGMTGSATDPDKRLGMYWTTLSEITHCPPGTTVAEYVQPSVTEQLEDPDSLLSYYAAAMRLRNENPEIARGTSEVIDSGEGDICVIRRSWNGESCVIVINPSENAHELDTEPLGLSGLLLAGELCASGSGVGFKGGVLQLPAYSIAILRQS